MSVSDTLIVRLKSLDEARYRELLGARPDALRSWQLRSRLRRRVLGTVAPSQEREEATSGDAVPEPYELAGHLLERSSVIEAFQRLSTPRLQVLEAVQVLGDGCRRHDLTALMDLPDADSVSRLDEVLDELATIALIWPDGDRLRIGDEAAGLETRIDELLAGLPSGAIREIALTLGLNLGGAAHRDQLPRRLSFPCGSRR